ncbi:MAG: hypothetical protein H6720_15235 [Sandaracinus sp.]|nr:hypothetical protein [Sandaracinus sp.]
MSLQSQNVAALVAAYTSPARFSSAHSAALALQLRAAAPKSMTADQRKALETVLQRAAEVGEIRKARERTAPPAVRARRAELASSWTSLHAALSALVNIPKELSPMGAEAAELVDRLFPEGVAFTTADALSLFGRSQMLLQRIEEEGLRARIDALVTPMLMRSAEVAFEGIGEVLGISADTSSLPPRALAEANGRFAYAVTTYARALSITLDPEDEAGVRVFLAAMAPIDGARVVPGRAKAADEEFEDEPSEPGAPNEPTSPETPEEDPDAPYVPASDDPIDNPFIT